jgi:hypothetical protein
MIAIGRGGGPDVELIDQVAAMSFLAIKLPHGIDP